MGQYYLGVNVDKKQFISPHKYDCGAKLLEWGYINGELKSNEFISALHSLMKNEWRGDRVYIVGDYANLEEYKYHDDTNWLPTLKDLYNEIPKLSEEINKGYKTLYDLVIKTWEHIDIKNAKPVSRFILNTATKEYIDLLDLPVEWTYKENDKEINVSIDPLPLLIAMGNGRGGGDYLKSQPDYDKVGSWVATSQNIDFADDVPKGYQQLKIRFTENEPT